MIELVGVSKTFNPGRHNEYAAVRDVSLAIEPGRLTALRGPSGAGKTTLLSLVGLLTRPTAGRVRLGGRDVSGLPERFMTELRRAHIGFVFQTFHLIRGLTLLDNVLVPALPSGRPHAQVRRRALELLAFLGLAERADSRAQCLSGGEAQRTAIARALINDPQVLIADEPTANLDSHLSRQVLDILAGLRDRGRTVIVSSHDPLVFDRGIADRVLTVCDGRVVAIDDGSEADA